MSLTVSQAGNLWLRKVWQAIAVRPVDPVDMNSAARTLYLGVLEIR